MTDDLRLRIARDIRAILELYDNLRDEAINRAGNPEIPGGDAMVMLGPSANPEAWSYKELSAALGRTEPHGLYENDTDPQPPLLVLATWEDSIRIERNQPTDLQATIHRAADYIRSSIDWCFDYDATGDMNFVAVDDMADDIHTIRARLEAILKDGDRLTRIRARCMYCDEAPRLAARYMDDPRRDHWFCPSCKHLYDVDGVRRCWHQALAAEGAAAWVTLIDAASAAGRKVKTVRGWTATEDSFGRTKEPKVRSRRNPQTDRIEVWWPDVRAACDTTPHRNRVA